MEGWVIQLESQLWMGVWAQVEVVGVQGTILVALRGSELELWWLALLMLDLKQGTGWWVEGGGCVQVARAASVSYFVVDVGWALWWHLLHDVDGVSVVPADFLVVRAVGRVRRSQWDDDVARLGAVVVGAADAPAASPLGAGERGQRQRGVVSVRVLGVPPPVAHDAHHRGHQQKEGRSPGGASDHGDVGGLEWAVLVAAALSSKAVGCSFVSCASWNKSQSHLRMTSTKPFLLTYKNAKCFQEILNKHARLYGSAPQKHE